MEYVKIPGTDLSPSRIGLGTCAIGGVEWRGTDEERSIRTICAALERRITLIDNGARLWPGSVRVDRRRPTLVTSTTRSRRPQREKMAWMLRAFLTEG